jgi:hypothetical protein
VSTIHNCYTACGKLSTNYARFMCREACYANCVGNKVEDMVLTEE